MVLLLYNHIVLDKAAHVLKQYQEQHCGIQCDHNASRANCNFKLTVKFTPP